MHKAALVVLVLAAGTLAAEDSPLVAAAKSRKNAKKKATVVITNDTLSKTGGHISTTASQPPLAVQKEAAKETPKAQVRTIGQTTAVVKAPEEPPTEPLPQLDDAERHAEGPLTAEELDEINRNVPVVILPKNLKPVEPQRATNVSKPQQSQKPKEKQQ